LSRDIAESTSAPYSLVERLGRRGFMGKLALGAMGLAGALAGLPQVARATGTVTVACCGLCNSSTSCTGTCCWSWTCCGGAGTNVRVCKECYRTSSCGPACPSKCSQVIVTHALCA
jgi:hypothetical protein